MTSDTIDYFMGLPDGANYVVLYQMLCLKTINTEGRFERQIGAMLIPYDVEKIRRDTKWFSSDTIRVALNLYKQFGLIYEDVNGVLVIANHKSLVGSETDYAEKNRRMRAAHQSAPRLPEPEITGHNVSSDVSDDVSIENRDKRLEIREQSTEIRGQISEEILLDDDSNDDEAAVDVVDEFARNFGGTMDSYELLKKADPRTKKKVSDTTKRLFLKAVGIPPTELDEARVYSYVVDVDRRYNPDRAYILTAAFYKAADAGHRGQWNYIEAIMSDMQYKGIDTKEKVSGYYYSRKDDT